MDKRGQLKIILIVLVIFVFIGVVLALFFVLKDNPTKMSDDEITDIVKNITDNEIIKIEYYEICFIGEEEYEKIYVVITKLKEKHDTGIFGEFEYKYYFLDEKGDLISEVYNSHDKLKSCEKLE